MTKKRFQWRQEKKKSIIRTVLMISFCGTSFYFLCSQFAFGISSPEVTVSLVSIQCFSALKFSLAKMASESAKPTSQNGISTSL